jgi:hypothetical protein
VEKIWLLNFLVYLLWGLGRVMDNWLDFFDDFWLIKNFWNFQGFQNIDDRIIKEENKNIMGENEVSHRSPIFALDFSLLSLFFLVASSCILSK